MKYATWLTQRQDLDVKLTQLYREREPLELRRLEVENSVERWWKLSDTFAFHVVGDRWSVWYIQHRTPIYAHQWEGLSSADLRAIANRVELVERWMAGGELAPSDMERIC
jgi:hypothetical protein